MRRFLCFLLMLITCTIGCTISFYLNGNTIFPDTPFSFVLGTISILGACILAGICARFTFGAPEKGGFYWALVLYSLLILHVLMLVIPLLFGARNIAWNAESYYLLTVQLKPISYIVAYTAGWLTGTRRKVCR